MAVTLSLTVTETGTSVANNTSTVKVVVKATSNSGSYNLNSPSGTLTIDGTKYSFSHSFSANTTTTLCTKTQTVKHNDDGTKTVSVKATFATGVSSGTISASKSLTLTKINRTFTISYDANGGSGAPSSQTKTYGTALTLSSTIPTRSGYTFLGWATSSTATAAAYSAGDTYTTNAAATLYAVWGSTAGITVSFIIPNVTYQYTAVIGSSFTFPSFSRTGYTLTGWATSSGGSVVYTPSQVVTWTSAMNTTYYGVWDEIEVSDLEIDSCSAVRGSGTYVTFTANFSGAGGTQTLYLYTKTRSASSYTYKGGWSLSQGTTTYSVSFSGYDTSTMYDILWQLSDTTGASVSAYDIISSNDYIWKSDGSTLDIAIDLNAYSDVAISGSLTVGGQPIEPSTGGGVPAGTVAMYAGTTEPDDWLFCDGSQLYRYDYTELFAAIGYTYGGSGSYFYLPNFTDRMPVGAGSSYDEGSTGGEATHTLTVDEIPSHRHTRNYYSSNWCASGTRSAYNGHSGQEEKNTGATGGGQAHNNMPPYLGINFIIKT